METAFGLLLGLLINAAIIAICVKMFKDIDKHTKL